MNRVAWNEAAFRPVIGILCCVWLCFCLTGCGGDAGDEKAALRRRAEDFGNLLVRIQEMPELEAKQALEEFIEPSPTQADRIAQYYRDFSAASKKFRIVSQSVTKISIDSDGVGAEVAYRTVAKAPGVWRSRPSKSHAGNVSTTNGIAPSESPRRSSTCDARFHIWA